MKCVWEEECNDAREFEGRTDYGLIYSAASVKKSFAMREKGSNHLILGPDYRVDTLKLSNQAPRVSGESLQTYGAWRCPDGTQHLFCRPILAVSGQSLASNSPVVDSR
ncbi:hypothetical protein TNCV_317251 [Trichonephila clavipes]|nr:hypothetical protein TNCV_317251 [Trichonephila clavipes]